MDLGAENTYSHCLLSIDNSADNWYTWFILIIGGLCYLVATPLWWGWSLCDIPLKVQHIQKLWHFAENCDYGTLKDEMIRDRLRSCRHTKHVLSQQPQLEANLTLEEVKA